MKKLPGKEDDGNHLSTTLQEIIHQLEQQNILLNSNFPLEDVVHQTFDGVILINAAQQIIYASPKIAPLFLYQPEDLLGQPLGLLIPNEYVNMHQRHVQEFHLGEQRTRPMVGNLLMITCKRKDGTRFPAEITISKSIVNDQSGPMFMGAFIRAVTERSVLEQSICESEEPHRIILSELRKAETAQKQIEERLRNSEKFLKESQRIAHVGSWVLDIINNQTIWSDELFRICGYEPGAFVPTSERAMQLIHPADRKQTAVAISQTLEHGAPYNIQKRIIRPNGEVRHVFSHGEVVYDAQGNPAKFIRIFADMTERHLAAEALRQKQAEFAAIFHSMPDAVLFANKAQLIQMVNPAFTALFGYTQEEVAGKHMSVIYVDQREDETRMPEYNAAFPCDHTAVHEIWYQRKDETLFLSETISTTVSDKNQHVLGLVEIMRDITLRKRAEDELSAYRTNLEARVEERTRQLRESELQQRKQYDALRLSEEKYRSLFETMVQGVVYQNSEGRIISTNPAAERILGLTFDQMVGHTPMDPLWQAIHEDGSAFPGETYPTMEALRTGQTVRDTIMGVLQPQKGTYTWININAIPEFYPGESTPYQVYATFEDITVRKESERILAQAKEEAEVANRAKSIFLANMSHELRTPLNAILGFAQLMGRDAALTAKHQEHLGIIRRSGKHLLDLISDVLEMSKIEAGRMTLYLEAFDLHEMLAHLQETMGVLAKKQRIQFGIDWDESLPRYVKTDGRKLQQVLINLINNAIRFTPEGTVQVKVTAEAADSAQTTRVFFEIQDTGIGIIQEELSSLFEPFVQIENGYPASGGTGLGLPISREFVRLMGGEIDVVSQKGKGTTFSFSIQVEIVAETAVVLPQSARKVIGLEPGQPNYRILIVDDQFESRYLLAQLLEDIGFHIRQAADGHEAIRQYQAWNPHLIWMDIRMPGMDGLETTRQIRATPQGQSIVIIALTAHAFTEEWQQILAAGCDDFVHKPFYETTIFEKLAQHLQVQYLYEAAPPAREDQADLSPEMIARLPSSWLAELHQAASRARCDQAMALIQQIAEPHPNLAYLFSQLVNEFQFDRIVALIEQNQEQKNDQL